MMARYVELVRVSTAGQADRDSPENQRRALDRLAKRRPGERVARLEALAVSGATPLPDTPAGERLLALAAERAFDELRVVDIDRVLGSRADDPAHRLAVLSLVRDAGAVIVDCAGAEVDPTSDMGEMSFYLRTFFAKQERAKLLARTRAGRERAEAAGRYGGAGYPPYGYRWDSAAHEMRIIDDEAEIVREIYARYAGGEPTAAIERDLDARGAKTSRGGRWQIRRMLIQPAYCGRGWKSGSATVEVPAIVSPELFDQVQATRASRGRCGGRRQERADVAVLGRVYCLCGRRLYARYHHHQRTYLYCATQHRRMGDYFGGRCAYAGRRHIAEEIDGAVWRALVDYVADPDRLAAIVADAGDDADRERLAEYEGKLDGIERAQTDLFRAHRRGAITDTLLHTQLDELAEERGQVWGRAESLRQQIAHRDKLAADRASMQALLTELQEAILKAGQQDRTAIIRALVPRQQPYGIICAPEGALEVRARIAGRAKQRVPSGRRTRKCETHARP